MNKEPIDLTLEEIVNHPEFVSIERAFHEPLSPTMYLVTFESRTRSDNPMFWLTYTGINITGKRYVFHTYLNKDKDGRLETDEDKGVQG